MTKTISIISVIFLILVSIAPFSNAASLAGAINIDTFVFKTGNLGWQWQAGPIVISSLETFGGLVFGISMSIGMVFLTRKIFVLPVLAVCLTISLALTMLNYVMLLAGSFLHLLIKITFWLLPTISSLFLG